MILTGRWDQEGRPSKTDLSGLLMGSVAPRKAGENTMQKISSLDPAKKVFSLFEEFKNFAFKGNVVDLAVGVIIGAAFGSIVKSLVENIFMPLMAAMLPGNEGYKGW